VALVALVVGLVLGWSPLLPVSIGALGAAYAVHLAVDDPALDSKVPLLGVGLLLTAELAYWSLEERDRVATEPGESLRRVGLLAGLALGALGAGAGLLAVSDLARAGGLAIDVLGAVAAATALLVVVLLARRPPA